MQLAEEEKSREDCQGQEEGLVEEAFKGEA